MAWIAGGVSSPKLIQVVQHRGIAFNPSPNLENELRSAGATPDLLGALRHLKPGQGNACSASLVKAATLVHQKKYQPAAELVGDLLSRDPQNGALHFALGYIQQQQGDWNTAFDEYSSSKETEPDFAEVHNRLALVFYQGDDGDSAIAEARTALSMDFQDADAYRMLGLGHYANEQYPAALNAFQESLARDPGNADVYYEMGMAEQELGNDEPAVQYFRKSLQLNPQHWQAHNCPAQRHGCRRWK